MIPGHQNLEMFCANSDLLELPKTGATRSFTGSASHLENNW